MTELGVINLMAIKDILGSSTTKKSDFDKSLNLMHHWFDTKILPQEMPAVDWMFEPTPPTPTQPSPQGLRETMISYQFQSN